MFLINRGDAPLTLVFVIVYSLLEYMETVVTVIILKIYDNFISKLELVGRYSFYPLKNLLDYPLKNLLNSKEYILCIYSCT